MKKSNRIIVALSILGLCLGSLSASAEAFSHQFVDWSDMILAKYPALSAGLNHELQRVERLSLEPNMTITSKQMVLSSRIDKARTMIDEVDMGALSNWAIESSIGRSLAEAEALVEKGDFEALVDWSLTMQSYLP